MNEPALGIDVKLGMDGQIHGWRAVLVFPDRAAEAEEFLFRLPDDVQFLSSWSPLHGDLRSLPASVEDQAAAIADRLSRLGATAVRMDSFHLNTRLASLLIEHGIEPEGIEVDWPACIVVDDFCGIGGEAGHILAHIFDPDLPYRQGGSILDTEQALADPDDTRVRAYRIDRSGITQLLAEPDVLLAGDTAWDCVKLDAAHDLWVDDEALLKRWPVFATIGTKRVPLPVYLLGADGERSTSATFSPREVENLVRFEAR